MSKSYIYYECVPMKASVFPSVTCAIDGTSVETKQISKRLKAPPIQRRGPVTFDSAWKKSVPRGKGKPTGKPKPTSKPKKTSK